MDKLVKDIYVFTNGTLAVFDEAGQQMSELQGMLTEEIKRKILKNLCLTARITFTRWRKGFFQLTTEEFMSIDIQGGKLGVYFDMKIEKSSDEANSPD